MQDNNENKTNKGLRSLLKTVTAQPLPYAKLCVVRELTEGNTVTVEPLEAPGFSMSAPNKANFIYNIKYSPDVNRFVFRPALGALVFITLTGPNSGFTLAVSESDLLTLGDDSSKIVLRSGDAQLSASAADATNDKSVLFLLSDRFRVDLSGNKGMFDYTGNALNILGLDSYKLQQSCNEFIVDCEGIHNLLTNGIFRVEKLREAESLGSQVAERARNNANVPVKPTISLSTPLQSLMFSLAEKIAVLVPNKEPQTKLGELKALANAIHSDDEFYKLGDAYRTFIDKIAFGRFERTEWLYILEGGIVIQSARITDVSIAYKLASIYALHLALKANSDYADFKKEQFLHSDYGKFYTAFDRKDIIYSGSEMRHFEDLMGIYLNGLGTAFSSILVTNPLGRVLFGNYSTLVLQPENRWMLSVPELFPIYNLYKPIEGFSWEDGVAENVTATTEEQFSAGVTVSLKGIISDLRDITDILKDQLRILSTSSLTIVGATGTITLGPTVATNLATQLGTKFEKLDSDITFLLGD